MLATSNDMDFLNSEVQAAEACGNAICGTQSESASSCTAGCSNSCYTSCIGSCSSSCWLTCSGARQ